MKAKGSISLSTLFLPPQLQYRRRKKVIHIGASTRRSAFIVADTDDNKLRGNGADETLLLIDWNLAMNRQALRFIVRNTKLPQRTRAQAQLQLAQMHAYTRYTQVKDRCIAGGRGRGILSDFRMSRVDFLSALLERQRVVWRTAMDWPSD